MLLAPAVLPKAVGVPLSPGGSLIQTCHRASVLCKELRANAKAFLPFASIYNALHTLFAVLCYYFEEFITWAQALYAKFVVGVCACICMYRQLAGLRNTRLTSKLLITCFINAPTNAHIFI